MVAIELQTRYFSFFFFKMELAVSIETLLHIYHITSRHVSSLKTSKRVVIIFFHAFVGQS